MNSTSLPRLLIFLSLMGLVSCAIFQPYENTDLVIESRMGDLNAAGMQVATVSDRGVTFSGSYGYSHIGDSIIVDDETLFQIASVSKTLVAVTLMAAVEEGLIELDRDINDYLPADLQISHPSYPHSVITPRMLATHSAGIGSLIITNGYSDYSFSYSSNESYPELGEYLKDFLYPGGKYYSGNSWIGKPGSDSSYSNEGVALLAYVIQCASGLSFQEYCRSRIVTPLGLVGYWFIGDVPPSGDLATPYSAQGKKAMNLTAPPAWPSGSFVTSAREYSKLIEMILGEGEYRGIRVLSEESIAEMLRKQKGDYSIIWYEGPVRVNGNQFLIHSGGLDGAHTDVYLDINGDCGFIVFSNSDFVHPWSYQEILKALDIRMREK